MIKPLKRKPMLSNEKPKKEKKNKLPPDAYKDEIDPIEMPIDDTRKFILSVKRGGEFGLPMCDIRQYQTTELYTGFTKKGINFSVDMIPDLVELLQVVYGECEEKNLLGEGDENVPF